MNNFNLEEIENWDLTWFAYDDFGRIGVFFSNGTNCILKNKIIYKNNYIDVLMYFNNLNPFNIHDINKDDDLIFYSQKGLFCFDITQNTVPFYELVAEPKTPLSIKDIDISVFNKMEKFSGIFNEKVKINSISN